MSKEIWQITPITNATPPHVTVSFMHTVREEKVKATAARAWRRNNEEEISHYINHVYHQS